MSLSFQESNAIMSEINNNQEIDLRSANAIEVRTKPKYISPICSKCRSLLLPTDFLDGEKLTSKIWFDSWTCSNAKCKYNKYILLDWGCWA